MSTGGSLLFDKTGPVSKIGLQLNYAYKVMDALGDDSQLSLGITAGGQSYSYNTTNAVVNQTDDPSLGKSGSSGFFLLWVLDSTIYQTTDNTAPIIHFSWAFRICRRMKQMCSSIT